MTPKPRGRPRAAEPLAHAIRVRMSAAQRLTLSRVAHATGGGVAGLVREAVAEYVEELERPPRWRTFQR